MDEKGKVNNTKPVLVRETVKWVCPKCGLSGGLRLSKVGTKNTEQVSCATCGVILGIRTFK